MPSPQLLCRRPTLTLTRILSPTLTQTQTGPRLLGGPSTSAERMGSQAVIGLGLADGPAGISATTGLAVLPEIEAATLNYAQSCYICKASCRELTLTLTLPYPYP